MLRQVFTFFASVCLATASARSFTDATGALYVTTTDNGSLGVKATQNGKVAWTAALPGFGPVTTARIASDHKTQVFVFATTNGADSDYAALSATNGAIVAEKRLGMQLAWYNAPVKVVAGVRSFVTRQLARGYEDCHAVNFFNTDGTIKMLNDNTTTAENRFACGFGNGRSHRYNTFYQAVTDAQGNSYLFGVMDDGSYSMKSVEISGFVTAVDTTTKPKWTLPLTTVRCIDEVSCAYQIDSLVKSTSLLFDADKNQVVVSFKNTTIENAKVNVTSLNPATGAAVNVEVQTYQVDLKEVVDGKEVKTGRYDSENRDTWTPSGSAPEEMQAGYGITPDQGEHANDMKAIVSTPDTRKNVKDNVVKDNTTAKASNANKMRMSLMLAIPALASLMF
jgi:hypothetical protein